MGYCTNCGHEVWGATCSYCGCTQVESRVVESRVSERGQHIITLKSLDDLGYKTFEEWQAKHREWAREDVLVHFALEAASGADVEYLIEQLPLWSEGINLITLHVFYDNEVNLLEEKAADTVRERLNAAYKKLFTRREQWFQDALQQSDSFDFRFLVGFVEKEWVLQRMDPNLLYNKHIGFEDENWCPECYFLAEWLASQGDWQTAFLLFQRVHSFNQVYKVTDEELKGIFLIASSVFEEGPEAWGMPKGLSVESIERQARECYREYTRDMSADETFEFVSGQTYNMEAFKELLHRERSDRRRDREIHNKLQEIWGDIAASKHSEAYQKWTAWDKTNVKIAGLDNRQFTCWLKDRMERPQGRGPIPKAFDLKGLIGQFEETLREFIECNGQSEHGDDWWKPVLPGPIKQKLWSRYGDDDGAGQLMDYCDFPDYADIICAKSNWERIFKKWFCLTKADHQKSKEQLTEMITKPVKFKYRNRVMHTRRPLTDVEEKDLRWCHEEWRKVYDNWRRGTESPGRT